MPAVKNQILFLVILVTSLTTQATWIEASGQAVIHDGQKQAARQLATQEAIKQALLFSGAAVKNVQIMANGLLKDDTLEITSAGDVNHIELINEVYHQDYVTVSIRADIFPIETTCAASDYKKSIVTTWYDFQKRQQAAAGNLYDFGKAFATRLQLASQENTQFSYIKQIEPYYLKSDPSEQKSFAYELSRKTNSQFVIFGEINEFSIETAPTQNWNPWADDKVTRNLAVTLTMYDGYSGEMIYQKHKTMNALWDFDLHQSIDSNSHKLWNSKFGLAAQELQQQSIQEIEETISCQPAFGRVIKTGNESLIINIGLQNGVKKGDKLTLFKMNQYHSPQGEQGRQFHLHPEKVTVVEVFTDTAIVKSPTGALLVNIQANDFVARQ
ncbi:flagella assembly protein FlgT [Paraglaciecola marina]|uniref:flagella assembly protein FlgT n=1 Tax=Paraglaciecola marina TaxID=2500157 RepID=UPI00105EE770|nr:flagella assembly protein FlgT [Paraglaciecola marina]